MPVQWTCSMTVPALAAAAAYIAAQHADEAVKAAAGLPVKLAGKVRRLREMRRELRVQMAVASMHTWTVKSSECFAWKSHWHCE